MRILITGGAGFIGANFIRQLCRDYPKYDLLVVDKMGYAANRASIKGLDLQLVVGDICNLDLVFDLVSGVDLVVHFAAESHVDNSLLAPEAFITSNIVGTFNILQACRNYHVRLHHISTDEVFGDTELSSSEKFTVSSSYNPSSPYSASKASADLLVRAWMRSFGIEATISNCSNNYGPFQHIEKLIPRTITNRLDGIRPRLYGSGKHIRDWIHVDDHNSALWRIIERGVAGQTYLIGANCQLSNLEVIASINRLMGFADDDYDLVSDRAGNDRRYAIDNSSITDLGWRPQITDFEQGLARTIAWYQENESWWRPAKLATETSYRAQGK